MKTEIIDKALRAIGMTRIAGNSVEPIMPHLLADIAYQIFLKDIAPLPLRHQMKQMATDWKKRYGLFNRPIFSFLTQDESVELTDWMDSVSEYLANEITMIRAKIIEVLSEIPSFEDKRIVSSLLLCNIFAEYAECAYHKVFFVPKQTYFGAKEMPLSNPDLCYLRDLSYRMALRYIKEIPGGDINIQHPDVNGLFGVVAKKIYGWLKEN